MAFQVLGLGGETHGEGGLRPARDLGQDVGIAHQPQGQRLGLFLDLLPGDFGRAVVGHCGGGDEDVDALDARAHGLVHGLRRLDPHEFDARRGRKGGRAADQHHLGAGLVRGLGQGIAHAARAAVAEKAHRIERLAGRARRHQHPASGEPRRCEGSLERGDDGLRFLHPALAGLAAGERSARRLQDAHAALAQHRDIGPGGRVCPHGRVHGRGHHHRGAGGQAQGGEQVVGQPGRHPRQEVGRGRGDEQQVRPPGEFDVRHGGLGLRVEQLAAHRIP